VRNPVFMRIPEGIPLPVMTCYVNLTCIQYALFTCDKINRLKRRRNMTKENIDQNLSKELIDLVREAMKSNVTKEEFKKFLEEKSKTSEDKSKRP
jgi:hypothetical protein